MRSFSVNLNGPEITISLVKNGINHSLKFEQLGLTPFTVMANVIDA